AATHSTPGTNKLALSRSQPSVPVPMMPNRTVSEGAAGAGNAHSRLGSSKVTLAATPAAAAPAPHCMNSRRVNEYFFMIDKTSFENCKSYKIYRRTVCQKSPASKSVLLNGEGTGGQIRSPSKHFWITSSSMGKGMRKRAPIRIAPTLPELIHR